MWEALICYTHLMSSQELVDLVNDNGEVVKAALPRPEAEKLNGDELHIPTIGCVILNSFGEVLVHERPKGKRFEGCLDHVYGAISSGESPEDAAVRECIEEVGARIKRIQRVKAGVNINHYYQYSFAVTVDGELDEANREVSWAEFLPVEKLRAENEGNVRTFTPNFFVDLDAALASLDAS